MSLAGLFGLSVLIVVARLQCRRILHLDIGHYVWDVSHLFCNALGFMPVPYMRIATMLRKKFSRGLPPVLVLFGIALLMSDTPAAAQQETVLHGLNGGANTDSWTQLGILRDLNTQGGDSAGSSVAISGDTVVVGAPMYTGQGGGAGAVYVFRKAAGGKVTQVATLQSVEHLHLWSFGTSVAIRGDTVVVGAAYGNNLAGAAYVFVKPKSGWHDMSESANLIASDQQSFSALGASVAISGNTIVVGAPGQGVGGAIYVFVKPKSGWGKMTQTAELTVSTGGNNDGLGGAVSISGDTIVAGASGVIANTGAAYIFLRPTGGWITTSTFNAELTSSDSQLGDSFGLSLATDGSTVVVGAPSALSNQGSAYVFSKPATGWTTTSSPNARLTASDGASGDRFGSSTGFAGITALVGAPSNSPSGAAYVFVEPSSGWKATSEFSAKLNGASGVALGSSIALQGNIAIAGAPNYNSGLGAAYVFGH